MKYDVTLTTIFNLNLIGGVNTYVANLSSGLRANHYKVKVISLGNLPFNQKIKTPSVKEGDRPVTIYHYQLARLALFLIALPYISVSKVIACQDIISFNTFYWFTKITGKKIVLHLHSRMPQELVSEGFLKESHTQVEAFLSHEEAKAFQRAPITIAAGKNNFDYAGENMSGDHVYSLINFVNTDEFIPATILAKNKAKRSFGLAKEKIIIGAVSRLTDRKGIKYLISAILKLPEKYLLVIAGDGPNRTALMKQVSALKLDQRVIFLGLLGGNNLKNFYKTIDILVVPSIKIRGVEEATALSAIEALSCGIPIVVTNVGGLPQLIAKDSFPNGIIVPERNAIAIAQAVIKILNRKSDYKIAARSFAQKYCSDKKSALVIAKIYGIFNP